MRVVSVRVGALCVFVYACVEMCVRAVYERCACAHMCSKYPNEKTLKCIPWPMPQMTSGFGLETRAHVIEIDHALRWQPNFMKSQKVRSNAKFWTER